MGGLGLYSHNSITGITLLLSLVVCPIHNRSNPLVHNAYVCMDLGCGMACNFLAAPGCVRNPKVKNFVRLCRFESSWCMGGLGLYSHNSITGITLLLSLVGDPSKFAIQQHASPWWFLPIEAVASLGTFWLLQAV